MLIPGQGDTLAVLMPAKCSLTSSRAGRGGQGGKRTSGLALWLCWYHWGSQFSHRRVTKLVLSLCHSATGILEDADMPVGSLGAHDCLHGAVRA